MSSYCSPGSSPVPFWTARLTLSAGMLTSLAVSIAAFSRMLPLGSPPPALAATVISRRILEKSLPRCTSALPFLRLICDHRECPDMPCPLGWGPRNGPHAPRRSDRPGGAVAVLVIPPSVGRQCSFQTFHALETMLAPPERGLPAAPLGLGAGCERPARPRP